MQLSFRVYFWTYRTTATTGRSEPVARRRTAHTPARSLRSSPLPGADSVKSLVGAGNEQLHRERAVISYFWTRLNRARSHLLRRLQYTWRRHTLTGLAALFGSQRQGSPDSPRTLFRSPVSLQGLPWQGNASWQSTAEPTPRRYST